MRWGTPSRSCSRSSRGPGSLPALLRTVMTRRVQLTSAPAKLASKVWDRYGSPRHVFDYQLGDRLAEELAFWLALVKRADIVHVLYGDEQLDLLLRRANLFRTHVIATFHFPA